MTDNNNGIEWEALDTYLSDTMSELERYVPYASVLVTAHVGLTIRVNHRERNVSASQAEQGAVFSLWCGDHFEEWATASLEPDQHGLAKSRRGRTANPAAIRI